MARFFFALLFLTTTLAYAAPPRVVPGSSVAYLYFPAASGASGKSVLTVEKQGTFKNYAVSYQTEDGTLETLCPTGDDTCQISLPSGLVTLAVEGFYGNEKLKIQGAKWSGDCSADSAASCKLAITSGDNPHVRITTGCDGGAYSVVQMGSSEVLCISESYGSANEILVGAHKDIGDTSFKPKIAKGTVGNTDAQDGRTNMTKLLSARSSTSGTSAAHYCSGLNVGGVSGWYSPAQNELTQVNSLTRPAEITGYIYTSTETDKKYTGVVYFINGSAPVYITEKHKNGPTEKPGKYKNSVSKNLCVTRVAP